MKGKNRESIVFLIRAGIFLLIFCILPKIIYCQEIVDRTVATVSDGVRTELITYSDLVWQLAMEPDVILDPPSADNLNRALQLIINQRLIALEARRLPSIEPTTDEVKEEILSLQRVFGSDAIFVARLRSVGFDSVDDDNFRHIMEQRVAIEKYLDFRFRSFVVITPEEETRYYRDVYAPDFRKKFPGLLIPALDEKRVEINKILTENKVAEDIEKFLDDAKRRATIDILFEIK